MWGKSVEQAGPAKTVSVQAEPLCLSNLLLALLPKPSFHLLLLAGCSPLPSTYHDDTWSASVYARNRHLRPSLPRLPPWLPTRRPSTLSTLSTHPPHVSSHSILAVPSPALGVLTLSLSSLPCHPLGSAAPRSSRLQARQGAGPLVGDPPTRREVLPHPKWVLHRSLRHWREMASRECHLHGGRTYRLALPAC